MNLFGWGPFPLGGGFECFQRGFVFVGHGGEWVVLRSFLFGDVSCVVLRVFFCLKGASFICFVVSVWYVVVLCFGVRAFFSVLRVRLDGLPFGASCVLYWQGSAMCSFPWRYWYLNNRGVLGLVRPGSGSVHYVGFLAVCSNYADVAGSEQVRRCVGESRVSFVTFCRAVVG